MAEPAPLGILGGTFDPVHLGHLRLAEEAIQTLGLGSVCWIPAGLPRLRDTPAANPLQRLAMVRLAIAGNPNFSIDESEVLTPTPSYTIDTLERLRRQHGPLRPLVLVLGTDAFARLEDWKRWREIFSLAHVAVATRPGHALKIVGTGTTALSREVAQRLGRAADLATAPAGSIVPFGITALEISATAIRQMLAQGQSPRYLVADAVVGYIDSNQLYR